MSRSDLALRTLVFSLLMVAACAASRTQTRQSYYQTSLDKLSSVTEQVIRQRYAIDATYHRPSVTSFKVVLAYDADKRPLAAAGGVPDGGYAVTLFVNVRGSDRTGRYLDIVPDVVQRHGDGWAPYLPAARATQAPGVARQLNANPTAEVYERDSWLAAIVDPIYSGVNGSLSAVAVDPPASLHSNMPSPQR